MSRLILIFALVGCGTMERALFKEFNSSWEGDGKTWDFTSVRRCQEQTYPVLDNCSCEMSFVDCNEADAISMGVFRLDCQASCSSIYNGTYKYNIQGTSMQFCKLLGSWVEPECITLN